MHCLTLRTGAKSHYSTHTPSLLTKLCTLVHLCTSARYCSTHLLRMSCSLCIGHPACLPGQDAARPIMQARTSNGIMQMTKQQQARDCHFGPGSVPTTDICNKSTSYSLQLLTSALLNVYAVRATLQEHKAMPNSFHYSNICTASWCVPALHDSLAGLEDVEAVAMEDTVLPQGLLPRHPSCPGPIIQAVPSQGPQI